jgi:FkbM family methyltransferase
MTSFRRAATIATDLACSAVGRRHVVRSARFVLRRACRDMPNDMRLNGELWLQRLILDLSPGGARINVIDVGANVGRWSAAMLKAAQETGRLEELHLHAFEPCSTSFALLSDVLANRTSVTLQQSALCERAGSSTLHILAPTAGTNSLHKPSGVPSNVATEEVTTITLDEYADRLGLQGISLVKIDTEGHDLAVLRGASALLAENRIGVVQFEYNHRWVFAHSFLHDAFELFEPFGYYLGKLTPRAVEFYPRWDFELETFVEGNYVACTSWIAERLPSVPWWKHTT